jgi:16S rRNA (guanine966-N2)-methyltransferase
MKLRIVSGSLKGRVLSLPSRDAEFRPTLERTRQSVADMLQNRLYGAVAADLCAGSGAFGFEMLSRGAARVDFVESDHRRVEAIKSAAERFGVEGQCGIIAQRVTDFVRRTATRYDIIFYDPPYDDAQLGAIVLPSVVNLLAAGGVLVYQRRREKGERKAECREGVFEVRNFGDTVVEFYRNEPNENP